MTQMKPAPEQSFQVEREEDNSYHLLAFTSGTSCIEAAFIHEPGEAPCFLLDATQHKEGDPGHIVPLEPMTPILTLTQTQHLRAFLNELHDTGLL